METNSLARQLMDESFGADQCVNEIIRHYKTFQGQIRRYFPKKHDTLLLYKNGNSFAYHEQLDADLQDKAAFKPRTRREHVSLEMVVGDNDRFIPAHAGNTLSLSAS